MNGEHFSKVSRRPFGPAALVALPRVPEAGSPPRGGSGFPGLPSADPGPSARPSHPEPGTCECEKVLAGSCDWTGAEGPPLQQEALSSGAWSRPSAQRQEELLGENVSGVRTPDCAFPTLPGSVPGLRRFVHLNVKCIREALGVGPPVPEIRSFDSCFQRLVTLPQ